MFKKKSVNVAGNININGLEMALKWSRLNKILFWCNLKGENYE
jgi:hypothetical protein